MKDAQYTVLASNRPIRVAFLVNTDSFSSGAAALDALVDSIVDWNHTHWGGRTNPIIFFNGNSLAEQDWLHLEVADPDCISVVGPITKELVNSLDDRLHPWGFEVKEKPGQDAFKVPHEAEGIAVPPTPANLRRLHSPMTGQEKLLLFELSEDCAPDIRRFIHRNFGTYYQWFDQNTKQVRRIAWLEHLLPKIDSQRVPISDPASLGAALTQLAGRLRRGDFRAALPFIAPFQLASLDLAAWPPSDLSHVYQLAIGDTAADFAEFWNSMLPRRNWSRTHEAQLWTPVSLIRNPAFHEGLLDWLRHYTDYGSQGRRVELISQTLPPDELEQIRKTLHTAAPPIPTNAPNPATRDRTRRILEEEQTRARNFIPWSSRNDVERFTGSSPTQRLPIPKPELLSDELNRDGSWMVDLQIEHVSEFTNAPREQSWWRIPRRNSASLVSSMFRAPARLTADSRFSVCVGSHNRFMSPVVKPEITLSLPEDAAVIHWLLTQPGRRPHFTSDVRYTEQWPSPPIAGCRVSEKGANLAALIGLFGDFWTAKSFCERRLWRHLFRRLAGYGPADDEKLHAKVKELLQHQASGDAPPAEDKTTPLADKILHLVRGRLRGHYVTLKDCVELRSRLQKQASPDPLVYPQGNAVVHQQGHSPVSHDEMNQGLNGLLDIGLLRLGIETTCPACKLTTWYHVNDLRQHLTCVGCGSKHPLRANERWSYALNTLAQTSVSQGVLGVLYALAAVASHSHGFFVFSPSLELFRHGIKGPWSEVDILCVAEGDFVIGEVKEGYVQKTAFADLAEVAEVLLPDRAIMFLPLEHATKQWDELKKWLAEIRDRLAPKGISAEIFTLPEY